MTLQEMRTVVFDDALVRVELAGMKHTAYVIKCLARWLESRL